MHIIFPNSDFVELSPMKLTPTCMQQIFHLITYPLFPLTHTHISFPRPNFSRQIKSFQFQISSHFSDAPKENSQIYQCSHLSLPQETHEL